MCKVAETVVETSYPDAISEYSNVRIFTNGFPWLFPGGIGDFRDLDRESDIDVANWAQHLLRQTDGRFQREKLWGFFAYNYCQRHRNTSSGGYFFINNHIHVSDPPKSLDELKEQLREGDSSFVTCSKLIFYSERVRGSDSYTRYTITEHVSRYHLNCRSHAKRIGSGFPGKIEIGAATYYIVP